MNRLAMYSPLRDWEKGQLPTSPFVHIMVGTCSKEAGHVLLSPQLMTAGEIDEAVAQMRAELDEFATKAKRELRELKSKIAGK